MRRKVWEIERRRTALPRVEEDYDDRYWTRRVDRGGQKWDLLDNIIPNYRPPLRNYSEGQEVVDR